MVTESSDDAGRRDGTCVIDRFVGPFGFLSNFYQRPVTVDGVTYRTAEHAFNALKTTDAAEARKVREAPTPALAKRAGRQVTLRPGWDSHVRFEVMRAVLQAKFTDPELKALLLATGDALLVEGNSWHDLTWGGFCTCSRHADALGLNHLGRGLMHTRTLLAGADVDRWPRVAVLADEHDLNDPWIREDMMRVLTKLVRHHHTCVAIVTTPIARTHLPGLTWWTYETATGQDQALRDCDALVVVSSTHGQRFAHPTIVINPVTRTTHRTR